jgi:molecular chaperone GrpE
MNSNSPQPARASVEEGDHPATEGNKLKQELAEQKDRYLRLAADFDNFRKRTAQETERRAAAQKESLIHELLPVIDNLERALTASPSVSSEQLHQGVDMILQQLRQVLKHHHIKQEESLGQPFDPLRHEAVASRHDPIQPDHVILETVQRGYHRGKDVFRPAKVIVNDLSKKEITEHAG